LRELKFFFVQTNKTPIKG